MSRSKPTFQPTHRTIKEIGQSVRIHTAEQQGKWVIITTESSDTIKSKRIKIRHG